MPLDSTTFDSTALNDIVSRFPAECRGEIVELTAHGGFSGAVIARVSAAAGAYGLRGWPVELPARARLRGLHRLLAGVHAAGVRQVPVPVRSLDGETVVESHGRCWQLEPWMPGLADFHQQPTPARLRNTIAVLAAFHRAAARFEPLPEERPWFQSSGGAASPAVLERRRLLREWLREKRERARACLRAGGGTAFQQLALEVLDHADRLGPCVAAQLDGAASLTFPLSPCIRDVWHDHVLFTEEEVTGLIDLGACRSENVAADLSRLLGSLLRDDVSQWDLALAAYHEFRPLSLAERGLIPVLDRSGVLLSGLGWVERRYVWGEASLENARVCARLAGIVGRLREMRA